MDIIQKQRLTGRSIFSPDKLVIIPASFSRSKAMLYLSNRSESSESFPQPDRKTIDAIYELYVKIGALNELPSTTEKTESFLSDLWIHIFYENQFVPENIPGDILIKQFTKDLVAGRIERRGNNMAAIVTCLNQWVVRSEIREMLVKITRKYYPNEIPKQLPKASSLSDNVKDADSDRLVSGLDIEEWPDSVLKEQAEIIICLYNTDGTMKNLEGFKPNGYMSRVLKESEKRGIVEKKVNKNYEDDTISNIGHRINYKNVLTR
jgi:hypothetical protein